MKPSKVKLFQLVPIVKPLKRAIASNEVFSENALMKILPEGHNWSVQYKADGIRAQAHKEKSKVKIFSDEEKDIPVERINRIIDALKLGHYDAILDGEILLKRVSIRGNQPIGHQAVAGYLHSKTENKELETLLHYIVWDILYLNGQDLTNKMYKERLAILEDLKLKQPIEIVQHIETDKSHIKDAIKRVRSREGAIIRSMTSTYWQNNLMYKVKKTYDVDVRVVKVEKTKSGAYVFWCADNEGNIVGQTYGQIHTPAKVGDIIRVTIFKVFKRVDPKTGKTIYHWWGPNVTPPKAGMVRGKNKADPNLTFKRIWEASTK